MPIDGAGGVEQRRKPYATAEFLAARSTCWCVRPWSADHDTRLPS